MNSNPLAPTQRGANLCKTESAKAHPASANKGTTITNVRNIPLNKASKKNHLVSIRTKSGLPHQVPLLEIYDFGRYSCVSTESAQSKGQQRLQNQLKLSIIPAKKEEALDNLTPIEAPPS